MADYEFYLCDDKGRRLALLKNTAFMSMSRTILGYGTFHIGIPFLDFNVFPAFLPDRRVEVWRSPTHGATMRREGSFFLRKYNVYTREEDNVDIIEFYGRSPLDILRRQHVVSTTAADYSKTDNIDDMMKEIVDENFITPPQTAPTGELSVDGTQGLGTSISHSFFGQNVLDILKELRDISFSLNEADASNRRIYFDVVEGGPLSGGGFGYIFRTYANQRGTDRTGEKVFSVENGNLRSPSYFEDYLDSFSIASILNFGTPAANGSAESPDRYLSRWGDIVSSQQSSEATSALNDSKANDHLQDGKADRAFNATFVDSPGSDRQPRSLYGLDWDLGDILPVRYAGKDFVVEVATVYISVNEDGKENIVGMSSPRIIQPPGYVTVDVDLPMSADFYMDSSLATTNFNTNVNIFTGENNGAVATYRSWIKPDFTGIPANAIFLSAILKLVPTLDVSSNARTISAHRCLRDVVATQATWNIWKSANNWGTAGASNSASDYDGATPLGTMSQPASPSIGVALPMTFTAAGLAEFQKMFDGTYVNNGIVLFVDTQTNDAIGYGALDNATPSNRPVITLSYSYLP